MKKITITIITIIFATQIFAQNISEKDTTLAKQYYSLAIKCYNNWNLDSSIIYVQKATDIYKQIAGQDIKITNCYNVIGAVYLLKYEYDKAYNSFYISLKMRQKILGKKNIKVASSFNNIGNVFFYKNDLDSALKYYFESVKIKKKILGNNHQKIAYTYNNIGLVYVDKKEHELALQYQLKSLQINLLHNNQLKVADNYNNLGSTYISKKEIDLALEYYFKSLEIKKELLGLKNIEVARSYNNIGTVYKLQKKYNIALDYYFMSLELKKELLDKEHIDIAITYDNIGNLYSNKKEYNLALEYNFKSLIIREKKLDNNHIELITNYYNIGSVYHKKNNYNLSLQYYQKAIASSLRNFNDTTNIYSVPTIKNYLNWNVLLDALQAKAEIFAGGFILSDSLKEADSYKLSLLHYKATDTLITKARQEIITKSDKLALGEQANDIYTGAINVCLKLYEQTNEQKYLQKAFYFSEKNKSSVLLEALAGSEALEFSGIPNTLLNLEHKLSIDIVNYINLKNNAENDSLKNQWASRLFKSQRSYDSLIYVFETQYPEYYNLKYNNSPATVEQVAKLLDKKTAMLSYIIGDSTITIFAISKKDFVVTQVPKIDSLNEKINDYRFCISESDLFVDEIFYGTHWSVALYEKLAFQLYNLLFPPEIQEFLKGGIFYDIENIIIIPDGQLATIPFETLHTKKYSAEWTDWKSKTYFAEMLYLINDYNISYSYSATLLQ